MESRPTMNDGQGIFRHLTVKQLVGIPLHGFNGIKGTRPDTAAAASASRLIDVGLALFVSDGIRTAFLGAAFAVTAERLIDNRFSRRVLLHLAGPASAAHADILDGTAKTR